MPYRPRWFTLFSIFTPLTAFPFYHFIALPLPPVCALYRFCAPANVTISARLGNLPVLPFYHFRPRRFYHFTIYIIAAPCRFYRFTHSIVPALQISPLYHFNHIRAQCQFYRPPHF